MIREVYTTLEKCRYCLPRPRKTNFYSKVYDDIAFAMRNIGMDEKQLKRE